MNWFERYGIVGMSFIGMTVIWSLCLFPECQEFLKNGNNAVLLKNIGWFFALTFLPCGYIIMIFSQLWYYLINRRRRMHSICWDDLPDNKKKEIRRAEKGKELQAFNPQNEADIEAVLTYYDRTKMEHPPRINQFLSKFATKRFDVVAINVGLIWAILLSFLAAIFIEGIILGLSIKWFTFSALSVIILALLIIIVLFISKKVLERQIFGIIRRKLRDISISNNSSKPKPMSDSTSSGS